MPCGSVGIGGFALCQDLQIFEAPPNLVGIGGLDLGLVFIPMGDQTLLAAAVAQVAVVEVRKALGAFGGQLGGGQRLSGIHVLLHQLLGRLCWWCNRWRHFVVSATATATSASRKREHGTGDEGGAQFGGLLGHWVSAFQTIGNGRRKDSMVSLIRLDSSLPSHGAQGHTAFAGWLRHRLWDEIFFERSFQELQALFALFCDWPFVNIKARRTVAAPRSSSNEFFIELVNMRSYPLPGCEN